MSHFEEVYNRFKNINKLTATDDDIEFMRCLGMEMARAIYLDCGEPLSQDVAYVLNAYIQSTQDYNNRIMCASEKGKVEIGTTTSRAKYI